MFDIGYRNFAFCLEEYSSKSIMQLKTRYDKLAKKDKIVERREHTPVLKSVLDRFNKQATTVDLELVDLNKGDTTGLTNQTRKNLNEYLMSKLPILKTCDQILVEQQFKTGVACNFDAILLGESTFSWLVFNVDKPVSYTPSKWKTVVLSCPQSKMETKENGLRVAREVTKRDRKKWSKETALAILASRGDQPHIDYIHSRKADDVSDCLLMALAWLLKTHII